jgi:uncharacterized membrane protein
MLARVLLVAIAFLPACSGSQKAQKPSPKIDKPAALADSLVKKQSSGTDFYASGNLPVSWTLDMDVDKEFVFTANDITARVAAVKPSPSNRDEKRTYHSSTTNGEMEIIIYKESCLGNVRTQKVEVRFNNTLYTGCGTYLYNPLLNGSWILE